MGLLRELAQVIAPELQIVPVIVTQPIRLITIKDIALFNGWTEERVLTDGIRVGRAMAARYRALTGLEPEKVPQLIRGKERLVCAYPQQFMNVLAQVWRTS